MKRYIYGVPIVFNKIVKTEYTHKTTQTCFLRRRLEDLSIMHVRLSSKASEGIQERDRLKKEKRK